MRPLKAYRAVSLTSATLLLIAFILFLLVGLSLTIIKPIYLLTFRNTLTPSSPLSIATELRFGVWGVCASSDLMVTVCFGPQLGYQVPEYITSYVGISQDVVNTVEKALLVVLILHPITAGLTLIALIPSLFLSSHAASIVALVAAIITAFVASVSLAIDLALVIVAQREVKNLGTTAGLHFEIDFGNGVWMIVTGVAIVWIAVVLLSARACYCLGVRRRQGDAKF